MTLAPVTKADPVASPVVAIRGLDVAYLRRRQLRPAVIGLDLIVAAGEVVAVVGESGSGKSTTANALLGLLPANGRITAGSVQVDGVETVGARERTLRRLRGRVVGLVPQDPMVGLNPTKRIGVQIAEVIRLRDQGRAAAAREIADYLQQAGVSDPELRIRQYPHELSGGLRQRVLIAIALAGDPKLIIADEPTSALDVTVQRHILDHLMSLVRDRGISLLIITHDLAVAADRADRVVVLRHGRVVEQGRPQEVLAHPGQDYTRRLIAAAPGLAPGGVRTLLTQRALTDTPFSAPILTLTGVSKTFPINDPRRGERGFNALSDVSVSVPRGRTHALVGESGCGKTTTLRIALGLETVTSGSVVLDGTEITSLSWRAIRPLRRKAQLVHQNPYATLDPGFSVEQSIAEPLVAFRVGDRATRRARVHELLEEVGLPAGYAQRSPAELSGGQRQRVAIARALALRPELIMLDEPVSALDVLVQQQILALLGDLQERHGVSYLLVSHDLAAVAAVAHTVSVMSRGQVVEDGPIGSVFADPQHPYTRELLDAVPGGLRRSA